MRKTGKQTSPLRSVFRFRPLTGMAEPSISERRTPERHMEYRKADRGDIEHLMALRKKQLIDEGLSPDTDIDGQLREFFTRTMAEGSLIEWVAEDAGEIVATAAVLFLNFPPTFTNPGGRRAYVTNMYTKDACRGRGIAPELLGRLVAETKQAGIPVLLLTASAMGRPVYEKFGFRQAGKWMEMTI